MTNKRIAVPEPARRRDSRLALTLILTVLAAAAAGCGSSSAPPAALSTQEVAPALESAFKDASAEAKSAATEAAAAVQQNDNPKALLEIQRLSARQDLTAEQREAAARSMLAIMEQLRQAAARGDGAAAAMLEVQRAHK
jgi:hypothetical protein